MTMRNFIIISVMGISIFLVGCTKERSNPSIAPIQELIVFPMSSTGGEESNDGANTGALVSSGTFMDIAQNPIEKTAMSIEIKGIPDKTCSGATIIESDIRGTSMLPLYHEGDMIRYSSGYYHCYDVQRNDIIIYNFPKELIIKRVVGIPGDVWKYMSGTIIINKKPLKNTEGKPYKIDSKMLELYSKSYPTIPKDTYLILGNQVNGTLDSSKFGLVSKQDIVGKVIKHK